MNHVYRVVWNHSKHVFEAVSEIAKGQRKCVASKGGQPPNKPVKSVRFARSMLSLCALSLICGTAAAWNPSIPTLNPGENLTLISDQDVLSTEILKLPENVHLQIGSKKLTIKADSTKGAIHMWQNALISIDHDGELNVYGSLYAFNKDDIPIIQNSGTFYNEGTVGYQYGTYNANTRMLLANKATGSVINKKAGAGKGVMAFGSIQNLGNIENSQNGIFSLAYDESINQGTIQNHDGAEITFYEGATLNNEGEITNGFDDILGGGMPSTRGTINMWYLSGPSSNKIVNKEGGLITNYTQGLINRENIWSWKSKIENQGGTINNFGVIKVDLINGDGPAAQGHILNNLGGFINASVELNDSSVLTNGGVIRPLTPLDGKTQYETGIKLNGESTLINQGQVFLTPRKFSSYHTRSIDVNDNAKIVNSGTVTLDDYSSTATSEHERAQLFFNIASGAKVENTGTGVIEIKDSHAETQSRLVIHGQFSNLASGGNAGTLKLGAGAHAYIGYDSENTSGILDNYGSILGTGSSTDPSKIVFTGKGGKLIMNEGSTLSGTEINVAQWYWTGSGWGELENYESEGTIKFTGQSNFDPTRISFYHVTNIDSWDDPWNKNFSGVLNIDVDAGVTQNIVSNIVKVTETGPYWGGTFTNTHDGAVNKLGEGTLILDGQNTYTHGTNVKAGELDVGGSSGSSASMLGPVAVASGATIGGHGTINGNVNVDAGAHLSAGAGTYNAGTLKINGNLILGAGSQIDYDLSDTANDSVIVSGHLETNGATVNVRDVGDISTGLMREIFNYGSIGSSSLGIGTTPIGSSADNFAITHNAGAKKIYINFSGSPLVGSTVLKFWNPDASPSLMGSGGAGVWSAAGNTWTNQHGTLTPGVLDSTADFAIFAGTGGAVTVDAGGVTAKGLQFLSSGYSLNGGQISLDSGVAGQTYISTGGSASSGHNVTINSVITGANGIHKLDAGTLILTAANTYTGGTTVSGGTLQGNVNSIRGAVDVKQNAAVVFDQDVAGTYNDVISGAGSLTKKGSGDLTLAGANSYTGGTTVDTGKLVGDAASLQGNMLVNAGATLAFNQDNQGTFAGNVGGDGDLIKDGAGTLILTGNNSYTGGTQINAGAVQGSAKSLSGDINLAASTAVTFDQSDAGTFVHNITGLGDVNKTGTGALTLTGNVTTTGTTNVQQGALNVGDISTSGKIDGNVNVASGAVVGGNGEIGGTLNLQNGAGVIIDVNHTLKVNDIAFGGANELKIAGITEINSASPVTKTVLESNTALTGNFDLRGIDGISSSTDYLFAGVEKDASNTRYEVAYGLSWFSDNAAKVTGNFTLPNVTDSFTVGIALTDVSGAIPAVNDANWDGNSLKKMGNGTLILNAANTYTGLTDVQSGKLVVGGSAADNTAVIAGDVNVHSGAVLGGHGRILGNVNVKSGATVAPGNSIGTLTVNNITFNPGSTYEFEANPNGTADKISATGSAKLNGGIVSVLAGAGSWADSTTYTILDAAGGLTGTFDSVNSNLAFLTPALSYDANNVYLKLDRNDTGFGNVTLFPWVSNTFNQRNTGWGIESTGAAHPVYQQIVGMNAWQALSAYDNLSGEIHGSVKSAMLTNTRYARNAVNQHLAANSTVSDANRAIWVATWGHDGHLKADGNAAKVDNKSFGLMLGADIYASEKTAVGAALGYERSSIKARSSQNSDADVDAVHLMAYTRSAAGPVDIKGSIGYSWLSADTTRTITVPGLYSKNKASYDGGILQAFVEASHTFDLSEKFSVTPYGNLAYSYLKTDSYTEKGGLSVLHGNSSSDSATTTTLGARGEWRLGVKGSAYANLGWQHTFGSVSPEAELNFIGGARYKVRGTHMDRNGAVIGFGTNFQLQPNVNIGAGYEGYFGDQSRDHGLNVQMELKF